MINLTKFAITSCITLCATFTNHNLVNSNKLENRFENSYSKTVIQAVKSSENLNPQILEMAINAHKCAMEQGLTKSSKLTIIDYSLPSSKKRLWLIDATTSTIHFHTAVAHGKGSGLKTPTKFSNNPKSKQSSIGVFLTGETYHGKHGYSLRLHGLEKGFNEKAFSRSIVVHGSNYVNDKFIKNLGRAGRSFGCLALDKVISKKIIDEIKGGTLIFSYFPQQKWLENSKFINCNCKKEEINKTT